MITTHRAGGLVRAEGEGPDAVPHFPLRVLVVEDEPTERRGLVRALELLGYGCVSATNGAEALAKHHAQPFDVIVSDWRMPVMDGIELCQMVRREAHYVYFMFTSALSDKEHLVQALETGADDFLGKPIDLDELAARLLAAGRVVEMQRALSRQNAKLRRDSQRFFRASRADPLTGARNRRALDEDFAAIVDEAKRYGHTCSGAMLDVDQFKLFNDTYGHVAGDEVLRQVAAAIRAHLRKSDTLYRYGGEEFFIVLPEQTVGTARGAVERVRRAVERLAIVQGPGAEHPVVTVSAGVAALGDGEQWIERADAALYAAKRAGRNRTSMG
jgi:diguanylate cyclase (GGDEF)-like protein